MERNSSFRHERDHNLEATRNLNTLDRLLAKLIESGPELDPQHTAQIRSYIRQLLGPLGLTGRGIKGAEGLLESRYRLSVEVERLPAPPTYPSLADFQRSLLNVVLSEPSNNLPPIPENLRARDVARHGQYEWDTVEAGNNQYTLDYLYELGKVMISPVTYQALFPEFDAIAVEDDWYIENGPQRALVLRTLGPNFVTRRGMDAWIDVQVV